MIVPVGASPQEAEEIHSAQRVSPVTTAVGPCPKAPPLTLNSRQPLEERVAFAETHCQQIGFVVLVGKSTAGVGPGAGGNGSFVTTAVGAEGDDVVFDKESVAVS